MWSRVEKSNLQETLELNGKSNVSINGKRKSYDTTYFPLKDLD